MSVHAVKWKQVELKTISFLQKCLIENKNLDVILAYFWPQRSRLTQQSLWIMFTSEICTFVFTVFKEKVDFPTEKHNQTLDSSFHSHWVCVCVCTHMYAHVAKQTQVFGVLLRSQALYSHQFHSYCTGVTDHCMHEKRQLSNKSYSVNPNLENIFMASVFCRTFPLFLFASVFLNIFVQTLQQSEPTTLCLQLNRSCGRMVNVYIFTA